MGRDATGHAALDCRRYRFVVDRHLLRAILARRSRSPGEQPQSLRQSTMLFRRLDTAGCRSNAGAALARPLLRRTQAERSATILLPNSSKREGHSDREVRALSKKLNLRPCGPSHYGSCGPSKSLSKRKCFTLRPWRRTSLRASIPTLMCVST